MKKIDNEKKKESGLIIDDATREGYTTGDLEVPPELDDTWGGEPLYYVIHRLQEGEHMCAAGDETVGAVLDWVLAGIHVEVVSVWNDACAASKKRLSGNDLAVFMAVLGWRGLFKRSFSFFEWLLAHHLSGALDLREEWDDYTAIFSCLAEWGLSLRGDCSVRMDDEHFCEFSLPALLDRVRGEMARVWHQALKSARERPTDFEGVVNTARLDLEKLAVGCVSFCERLLVARLCGGASLVGPDEGPIERAFREEVDEREGALVPFP